MYTLKLKWKNQTLIILPKPPYASRLLANKGLLLKTNYERGYVFKLFTKRVCSSMDAARRTGDIGVAGGCRQWHRRDMLSWRVSPVTQARHVELEGAASADIKSIPPLKIEGHEACRK